MYYHHYYLVFKWWTKSYSFSQIICEIKYIIKMHKYILYSFCIVSCPAVFSQLLHQVQCSGMMASVTLRTAERLTVFQLLVYLSRWSITDFGEHISLLSKEGNGTDGSHNSKNKTKHWHMVKKKKKHSTSIFRCYISSLMWWI